MKKRVVVYGGLAAVLLAYLGFLALCSLGDDVTKATFDQLEIGMTKSQVRGILGFFPDERHHWVKGQVHENWLGADGAIMLAYDDDNRLILERLRRKMDARTSDHCRLVGRASY